MTIARTLDGLMGISPVGRLLRRGSSSLTGPPAAPPQPTIEDLIARVRASKGAIIFLPSIPWCTVLFQRPHHLARFFAREGYVTIYDCNYPGPALDDVQGFREIEPNLFLFRGPQRLLAKLPRATLWSFPYNYQQTDRYPARFATVYDWIDALEIFYHHGPKLVHHNHELALREATVDCHRDANTTGRGDPNSLRRPVSAQRCGLRPLRRRHRSARRSDDPASAQTGQAHCRLLRRMASWFDYDLLTATAHKRPDWNFLLIGPQYDQSPDATPPSGVPNLTWIGPRDYQALPGYLRLFDVAMIPFQVNEITKATSPLKLYEFFAGGKPVISSPMPECQAYPEVHVAATVEQFTSALDAALEESRDTAYCEHLRGIGRRNSWACRVQTVAQTLDQSRTAQGNWRVRLTGLGIGLRRRWRRIRRALPDKWSLSAAWGVPHVSQFEPFLPTRRAASVSDWSCDTRDKCEAFFSKGREGEVDDDAR